MRINDRQMRMNDRPRPARLSMQPRMGPQRMGPQSKMSAQQIRRLPKKWVRKGVRWAEAAQQPPPADGRAAVATGAGSFWIQATRRADGACVKLVLVGCASLKALVAATNRAGAALRRRLSAGRRRSLYAGPRSCHDDAEEEFAYGDASLRTADLLNGLCVASALAASAAIGCAQVAYVVATGLACGASALAPLFAAKPQPPPADARSAPDETYFDDDSEQDGGGRAAAAGPDDAPDDDEVDAEDAYDDDVDDYVDLAPGQWNENAGGPSWDAADGDSESDPDWVECGAPDS